MGKKIASCLAFIGLLLLAACAAGSTASGTDDHNGVYGGVSGGWTHP